MLRRRLIFFYLFILFSGIVAQRDDNNIEGEEEDDENFAPSINNGKSRNKFSAGNTNNNNGDNRLSNANQLQRPGDPPRRLPSGQDQVNPPVRSAPIQNVGDAPVRSYPKQDTADRAPSGQGTGDSPARPPLAQVPAGSRSQSPMTQLAADENCRADVSKYCAKGSSQLLTNLKVLQCIDDLDNAADIIDRKCQDVIFDFKRRMTHDPRFDDAAKRQCSKDLAILDACAEHTDEPGSGRLISCLYDHLANITESSCRYFVNQLQAVVFNDWRLTEYFIDACKPDIEKLECGRLDDDNHNSPHEQGAVVSCLSQKYSELNASCRKQIFRLAEMQSDDYHLDRALYYACRDDRERFCAQIPGGNGRVYRCLYDQKFNSMMTAACRKEIHRRQSLVVANVKLDVPLVRACNSEMREHKCSIDPDDVNKRSSLVRLLLCLEETLKKGNHIQDECRREMLVHRRMLMSDYQISPDIVSQCKAEMLQHCPTLLQAGASGTIDQRGGRMIHCLLGAARNRKPMSSECLSVVNSLMRAVNPGGDIRADPLLETTCRPVIDVLCPRIKPGDSNVIMCLLDNLKNPRMTEECEDRLMEVAYFMARDWRLTPKLMRTCRDNLVNFCQLPKDWSMNEELNGAQIGMYLGCLYQRRYQLENECRTELKRLMHIRTQSIGLMPEIENNCLKDLADCKNPEVKGEEMKCLQRNYNDLEERCKAAVRNFTQMTISDPTLDFLLMKACEPMIQTFCSNIDNGKENDLIRCLIKHKNEQKMDFRCKAGIDHHQITSMKDEAFLSQSFRKQCRQEVTEHCTGRKTKALVIQCLADLMLQDVLKRTNQMTKECRDELKFELLQRSESIDFDPLLAIACQKDIKKYCGERTPGNAEILDCLKEHRNQVSPKCYRKLKRREKLDVVLPENDYSLMSKCALVIQKFCANENKQNILICLRRNINQDATPATCRRILYQRLMILNSNARFNKGLIDNCQGDINKHCHDEVLDSDVEEKDSDDDDANNNEEGSDANNNALNDREMGGRVIECLRRKYVDTPGMLDAQCVTELIDVIQTSKLDVKIDIQLYQKCQKYLTTDCTGMEQEDCLKLRYQKGQIDDIECREQVKRIIREGQADIHVDRALAFSCQADILKYCNDIPIGSGKQLQCLLNMRKSVAPQCEKMLHDREELWGSISQLKGLGDVTTQIRNSNNSVYLFSVILLILCVMFMAGCVCRPYMRYNRVRKYK